MVPTFSYEISRVSHYSGYYHVSLSFAYMTITFFGMSSHTFHLELDNAKCCPNPESIATLGLASFAFARHYSQNLGWFLFLALLRCFSSGGSPHIPILFSMWCMNIVHADCSIRISADHIMLADPRSFSQLTTSFVGSWCQGILPTLLLAWPVWIMSRIITYVIFLQVGFRRKWLFISTFFFPSNNCS